MGCELCDLVKGDIRTELYYSDKTITIVDCLTCKTPMVVFNHHGEATEREREHALSIINYLFEYDTIRKEPRRLRDHEHWHLEGEVMPKDPSSCRI